jgi:hypothetical protein
MKVSLERRVIVETSDYELIVAHLIRCGALLEQAQAACLEPEDFQQSKLRHFQFFWKAACRFFEQQHDVPSKNIMKREVDLLMQEEELVTDRMQRRVDEFYEFAYALPSSDLQPDYIRDNMLQEMIDDLKLRPNLQRLATVTDQKELADLFACNQEIFDRTRVVVNKPVDLFSKRGRKENTQNMTPVKTGIDFIDYSTGGLRPASMVGLIAESSGGKTLFGNQFLCEQAIQEKLTLGFFYEQSIAGDVAERFYSYLTGATREELKDKTHEEYPERVRRHLDAMEDRMSKYLQVYDMSGSVKGQGLGGPKEVEAIIARAIREGNRPEAVVIDWLGTMEMKCQNIPSMYKEKRQRLEYCLTELKQISERFKITICVLHQIAAHVIEGKTPHFKPEWTMAHECKSFGHQMDYVFTFGRKCEKTECMWFTVSKARGSPRTHRIVKMIAQVNKIVDASGYTENAMASRDGTYFNKGSRPKGAV